ncbi:hypothetical protein WK13_16080 [Burkholderia ubonensis]|uniref:hypothetical protein n=1 Tax=Burkholderia ubonensis TaxID=101571 RepID=UPI00075E6CB1|nr:hypothetical protein WK13_16080 [Burkholderia ubonensis]
MPNLDDLPDDVATLKAMLAEARASAIERELEIEQLRRDIAESDLEITRLKLLIDKLKRMHFGRKSEQLFRRGLNESRRREIFGARQRRMSRARREGTPLQLSARRDSPDGAASSRA